MKDVRVFGHKMRKTIKEMKRDGFDVDQLSNDIRDSDSFRAKLENLDDVSSRQEKKLAEEAEIEVAELYTRILNDKGIYEYHVAVTGRPDEGNPTVLSVEKSPFDKQFIPMGIFRPVEKPEKFYGFGVIEPNTGILDAEEDTLNMALEALWTDISRPVEVQVNNILDISKLEYKPRTIVPVKQLGQSLAVMPTPTPHMNGVQFVEDYLQRAKQNVSGITDFQTGSEQLSGQKTLGEIQIKTQESNARLQMMMDSLEKEVIEPIGKMALWMNQQFLVENPKIIYRVVSRKGEIDEKPIKFKDIEAVKDVIVIAGSSALVMQQAEIQKWTLLLNQAYLEEKEPNPVPINKEAIWERLLEDGLLVKDVENFLPSVKEREGNSAKNKTAQIADAKEENANPLTARVLPTDVPEVHIPLHQAEIKAREAEVDTMEQQGAMDDRKVEELQMLIQHLDSHMAASGGVVPPFSAGMQVGQGTINAQANPQPVGGTAGPNPAPPSIGQSQIQR
jgi:hypothetical protein